MPTRRRERRAAIEPNTSPSDRARRAATGATSTEEDVMSEDPMSDDPRDSHRLYIRGPLATPSEIARQDPAYPGTDAARPDESLFADWRTRLARNLSRRSDGRWDSLTYVHDTRRDSAVEDR